MIEDRLLIWTFKRGSRAALLRIDEKYRRDLLKLAVALVGDVNEAEDVVQDVFVRFAQSAATVQPAGNLRKYLVTCTANRIRNRKRDQGRHESTGLDGADYAMKYFDPTHSRTDSYKDGQIVRSHYSNSETMAFTAIYHTDKHYLTTQYSGDSEGFLEKQEDWTNPRYLVQKILSAEHKKLGRQIIDGVPCEGLETSDPAVMAPPPGPVDRLEVHMRLWVDAKTEYPVRFEAKITAEVEGQVMGSECVMDQFQWDVEHEPSVFEPSIPPDYEQI